jgi:hypothetical protein
LIPTWETVEGLVFDEPPEAVEDELAPHAVAVRATVAAATTAAAVRGPGSHARRGRRMTRVLSFMVPPPRG